MNSSTQMKHLLQLMESISEAAQEADEQETLMNKLYDIAGEIERIVSLAEPRELHVEPDVEQAYKHFLSGDYEEAANALLDRLSDLRTSDPAPDPGYYGDIVYDMLMDLVPQHGHMDENDSNDINYLNDEESAEFESGNLVRFTDEYAEPDAPDAVYTLKDWDPVKGRGWAVDEDGQGWSVQSFQIQHARVDEALSMPVAEACKAKGTDMRELMETMASLFDDRVESDTARYYADQERAEQQAEEDLPYDIEDIEHRIRTSPEGKQAYKEYFVDNVIDSPKEEDIDLLIDIIEHYFENVVGDSALPMAFSDTESMDQLIARHLQQKGHNVEASDIERRRR